MSDLVKVDICVIGAGSGGLSVATGASQMGATVALVEKGEMGGDCLNTGCVPSKSLLAAARSAEVHRQGAVFGVHSSGVEVDFGRAIDHVHEVIAGITPHDSQARMEALGIRVFRAAGRFMGPDKVQAGNTVIRARRFVIATGSSALVPPIPGLDQVPYLTNETIFANRTLPGHLIVIGGGPIGLEMAQAHRRLGARVTVLEMARVLPRDDAELAAVVATRLRHEGTDLMEGVRVTGVTREDGEIVVNLEAEAGPQTVRGTHLLVAAGRKVNVEGMGLEAAGVRYGPRGVKVDARLRSSNRRVYAVGDVAGSFQFTHMAGYHAGVVLRNLLFRLPAKASTKAVPWVTYTDPELAHVGMSEDEAVKAHGRIRVLRWPFAENDRARAERETDGLVKVLTTQRGKILGAGIVGAHAGDLLQPWVLAISNGLKIGALAGAVAPYPTRGEASKRAAGSFYTAKLFGERTRKVVRFLARFG